MVTLLPTMTSAASTVVMTADEFVNYLSIAVKRNTRYGEGYPYNVGYYNGEYISWDCWNLGKTIIATRGAAVNNYTPGTYSACSDTSIGLYDTDGDGLESACGSTLSSDFSNIAIGEWLFKEYSSGYCYHVGYYIGNGRVIEATSDGSYSLQISTIDSSGHCGNISGRGSGWAWTFHGKVPWINYAPSYYLDLNGNVDGVTKGNISGVGDADVYIRKRGEGNYTLDGENVNDYYKTWPTQTNYVIRGVRGFGYQFIGYQINDNQPNYGPFEGEPGVGGTIGNGTERVVLYFTKIPESSIAAKAVIYNGHVYERYDYHLSWTEAKAFCESKGGHLVSITNAQEQAAVVNLLSGCPFGVYYIGGYDLEESGNWSWVSGEPFTYENWDRDYQEGVHQDPDNFYSAILGHDNPVSKQTGEWIDNPNEVTGGFYGKQNSGFICEYEKTYTVSYDANGGTSAPESQKKVEGVALRLSTDSPQNTIRYNFIGWSTNPNATTPEYYGGDLFEIDADTTLYAVWEENFLLSFDANGGTGGPAPGMVRAGTQVYIDQSIPVYEGHEFLGWATEQTADVAEYQLGDRISMTQDTTLYAVWKAVFVSDWTETRPESIKDEQIETKTQYRYSTKETTTDTVSSKPGWTLTGSQQVWGNYGDWSSWSLDAVSKSDSREVETTAMYRYYYFYCPVCGRHEPFQGMSDCGQYSLSSGDSYIGWFTTPYDQSNYQGFSYTNAKYYTTSLGDGQTWCFSAGNLSSSAIGTKDSDSDAVVITTGYRYRTRSQSTVYNFERWTNWSEWSDTPMEASDAKRVETRTLYRCKIDEDRVMTLPVALTKIESEAFQNIAADAVVIPESVRSIADDAFDAGIVIIGKPNSYAKLYAGWNDLLFIPNEDING